MEITGVKALSNRSVNSGPRGSVPLRYTPEVIEDMSIAFPATLASSVAFGREVLTDI